MYGSTIQGQFFSSPHQPEYAGSPEPDVDYMQVETTCLTPAERQCWLTQGLCLYCGAKGHVINHCPICHPCPVVSFVNNINYKLSPLTSIVCLTASDISISINALIDSGSAGNFISGKLCDHLKLKKKYTEVCYKIHSITGKPLSQGRVRHCVGPVQLQVGLLHVENIELLVLENSTADNVLGHPWLIQHEPVLSWATGEVLKWREKCLFSCFPELPISACQLVKHVPVLSTSIESLSRETVFG